MSSYLTKGQLQNQNIRKGYKGNRCSKTEVFALEMQNKTCLDQLKSSKDCNVLVSFA